MGIALDHKKDILIITQYFTPDITAVAYRMEDMYESIKEIYNVDILTSFPVKSKMDISEDSSSNIYRVKIDNQSKDKWKKYLNEYLGFMIKCFLKSKDLKKKYDYVFVTSPPIFTLIAGYILAKKKKAKLIIDIRDIWPDSLLVDGTLKEARFLYKIVKRLEIFMYRRADQLTCVALPMKKYIQSYTDKEITIIYNGVSTEYEELFRQNATLDNEYLLSENRPVLNLFYIGNLGYFQHVDVLLTTFIKYSELQQMFQINIIGAGTKAEGLKALIKENDMYGIKMYGEIPKEKVMDSAKNADILFLNLVKNEILKKTIPSKLFDYLYLNRPILYGIEGEGKEIIEQLGCGVSFEWDNEDSLYEGLMQLQANYGQLFQKALGNRQYVVGHFDRREMFWEFWEKLRH